MHLRVSLFALWHRTLPVFPGFSAHHPLNMSVPRALSQAPSLLAPHSLLVDHPLPHSLRNMLMGLRPLSSPGPLRSLHPQGLFPTRHALVPSSQQIQDCSPGGRTAPLPVLPISGECHCQAEIRPTSPPSISLSILYLVSVSSVFYSLHLLWHSCGPQSPPPVTWTAHLQVSRQPLFKGSQSSF